MSDKNTRQNDPSAKAQDDNKLNGQATAAEIAAWKAKYPGGIYAIYAPEPEPTHVGYFKNPMRIEVNVALAEASVTRKLASSEKLAELTFIGGSEELLKREDFFLGICDDIRKKMDGVKTKVVNL